MAKNFKRKNKKFESDSDAKSTSSEAFDQDNVEDVDQKDESKLAKKDLSSKDNVRGESSTPLLKTVTDYGPDTGDSFYTSLDVSSSVGNNLIDFYKSVTTLIRDKDNTVNKYFRNYDACLRHTIVSDLYVIDSPMREVTVSPITVIYNDIDNRIPTNKIAKTLVPDYPEHYAPKVGTRSLNLNLDGGLIRGAITSTSTTDGDTLNKSILDKYNLSQAKGTIEVVADSIVAANVNDIGIVATTPSRFNYYANKASYIMNTIAKTSFVSAQYDDFGYNSNIDPENYVSDNILNKTNVLEKMFELIQEYNVDNNSILRAISDQVTLNITMNAVTPFTTMMVIYYLAMKKAIDIQIRKSSVVGAVDSTFANLAQSSKFNLNAVQDALEKFRKVLIGLPYDKHIVDEFLKTCDPTRLLDTSSNSVDNSILFPTYKFVTNTSYNYTDTTLSNRTPTLFDATKGTIVSSGWVSGLKVNINSTDRRMITPFRQTVSAVAENVPIGSWIDIFNQQLYANLVHSDWFPVNKFKDFNNMSLGSPKANEATIKWLYSAIKTKYESYSGVPSISEELFTTNPYGLSDDEVTEVSSLLNLQANTDIFGLHPIVSAGSFTAYMRALALFITREKTFIDNFSATMERTKLYFKTLEEKIGFQDYYQLISDDTLPSITFDNKIVDEFAHDVNKVRDFFYTPFVLDANYDSGKPVPAYPVYSLAAFNTGTASSPNYSPSINRAHLYIKKDGSTYTNPLYSRVNFIIYKNKSSTFGFTSGNDTLCFNNDIITLDIYDGQQYVGEHLFSIYNGNTNSSFFLKSIANSNCISKGWGNYSYTYGLGKAPNRPRFQQRVLGVNTTTDGLYQSPIYSAFDNPYMVVIKDSYSYVSSIVKAPVLGTLVQPIAIYDNPLDYFISYVRNTTGLAVGETRRRHLIDATYRYGKPLTLIRKNYIGY